MSISFKEIKTAIVKYPEVVVVPAISILGSVVTNVELILKPESIPVIGPTIAAIAVLWAVGAVGYRLGQSSKK